MIKILIADDHAVVREGIKRIIADAGDMTVTAEANDGDDLLAKVRAGDCDVALMDLAMPGMSGLELLQEIRRQHPKLPVLVLTIYPEDQYAVRTLMAGASGYVHKGDSPAELITAIRKVAAGNRYITPKVAELLASHVDPMSSGRRHENLSNREYEVMCLVATGKSISEVAEQLLLSVKTVSTFRRRILDKLGLHNTAQIIRYAIENRLVD